MPWTMAAFAVGALSLVGIPPAAGFLSKWFMFQGAAQGGHWLALAVLSASTVLNAAYFAPILYRAFLVKGVDESHGEAPASMVGAMMLTAAATLALPFFAALPLEIARAVAGAGP